MKDSKEVKHNLPTDSRHKDKKSPQRRICDLTIVADHLFYADVGEKSVEKTILQMLWHIKAGFSTVFKYEKGKNCPKMV